MSTSIPHTYRYAYASQVAANDMGRPQLSLATSNSDLTQPHFFDGRARAPRELGQMLYTLSDVVRTHFFKQVPALLDPVVTSNESLLRLEGFSGCAGVYARVDLPRESFSGETFGRGTTNVDFNQPMRNALLRLRDGDEVDFAVGKDEVVLSKGGAATVEKKVKLPLRWIKGFSEVQNYQPELDLKFEISAADALRFIRALPKSSRPKLMSYAVSAGRGLRLSQRPARGAVRFSGTHRVKVLEPLLPQAKSLRIWADDESGTSAWEVVLPSGGFFLMLSPETHRGFSGEGQALSALAKPVDDKTLTAVRAQLKWGSLIDPEDVARRLSMQQDEVMRALSALGTRGLAGFDVGAGQYFHRELPFNLDRVEAMQPRLKNARKLVEAGGIKYLGSETGKDRYGVPGTNTTHIIRLSEDVDDCTCAWFSKYQGQRGPCKHVLAARIQNDARTVETIG